MSRATMHPPEPHAAPPEAGSASGRSSRRTALRHRLGALATHPLFAVITAFVVLVVVFSIVNGEAFAATENFRNIALDSSITLILAAGATYVIITAGIDLSIGSVLVFAGVVAMKVMLALGGSGWPTALAGLAAALAAGGAWGLVNGLLVAKARLNPIIVTLGSLGSALGLAQVITSAQDLVDVPTVMIDFGGGRLAGVPLLVFLAGAVVAVMGVVLAKTVYGRRTYAIGSSEEAARRAGLPVERHLISIYVLSGATAGLAGWLSLARFSTTSLGGHSLDSLNAITGVLLGGVSLFGGVGSMLGTVFGSLIPGVLANGLVIANVQSYWQQVLTGAVLIAAVYLDKARRDRNN